MAPPPLLTLSEISLGFGGNPLLEDVTLAIGPGERLGLVGRNGSGKSTLMKIMGGLVDPDGGTRFVAPASGGERRRAALARLMAQDADLWLLDEPTNHLDIQMIDWLEERLEGARQSLVLISHDRAFLRRLTKGLLWVDRGTVRRLDRGFDAFEDWRDKLYEEEDLARHKLDRLIKAEGRWAVEGISARRKRNMGRVRRLQEMRAERAADIRRSGTAELALAAAPKSGKLVVEAEAISKSFGPRTVVRDFSIKMQRGECLAMVGPNGAGKTTLLKLLTGLLEPDEGRVRLGTNLDMAMFDQNRAALDPEMSLWNSLAHDPELGVKGKNDQVMVRGRPRHVVGYLKDFLFTEAQARSPVRALSGGERARLLLARIMARESNLLVLDEPTNDLDIETLDLLQEQISEFDGTVLLVSHDRDFIDRVADRTVTMTGDGRATVYAGGYSDMLAQGGRAFLRPPEPSRPAAPRPGPKPAPKPPETGLSKAQERRLAALPGEMEKLSKEIAKLEEFLSDPELYNSQPAKFAKATEALVERQDLLAQAEEEWLELEELREQVS